LAEAIRVLCINKKLRLDMASNARVFVSMRYSKERLINDIQLLYNKTKKGEIK